MYVYVWCECCVSVLCCVVLCCVSVSECECVVCCVVLCECVCMDGVSVYVWMV
jgi:heme exporter protein D